MRIYYRKNLNLLVGPNVLPLRLTDIQFGSCFNQSTNASVVPSSLAKLSLGPDFNQPIREKYCKRLIELPYNLLLYR